MAEDHEVGEGTVAVHRWFLLKIHANGLFSIAPREGFQTYAGLQHALLDQESAPGDTYLAVQGWQIRGPRELETERTP